MGNNNYKGRSMHLLQVSIKKKYASVNGSQSVRMKKYSISLLCEVTRENSKIEKCLSYADSVQLTHPMLIFENW